MQNIISQRYVEHSRGTPFGRAAYKFASSTSAYQKELLEVGKKPDRLVEQCLKSIFARSLSLYDLLGP